MKKIEKIFWDKEIIGNRWKNIVSLKKTLKFFLVSGTHRGGFQFIVILTPYGVPFLPVVVICLGKNLLLRSVLGHCGYLVLLANLLGIHRDPKQGIFLQFFFAISFQICNPLHLLFQSN